MKNILVIYKKEVSGFFKTPMFYFLAFMMTLLIGILFSISLQKFAESLSNAMIQFGLPSQMLNIHYAVFLPHLSVVNLVLIFLVPALTMRLISEEKKNRSFDLLLTSPISSLSIVLGKYFAALTVVFCLILISCIYPLMTKKVFEFYWAGTLVAALGIFLVGSVYTAMNLFASSLTENTLVAFVLAVAMNLGVWFLGAIADNVDNITYKPVVEHLSLNTHLASLIEGTLQTSGLVFFLSVCIFFCFLTERVVDSARWSG